MNASLDYRAGFLCVLVDNGIEPQEWFPVSRATLSEVATLVGRPVKRVESDEGLYVDEDGNPYQLTHRGGTKRIAVRKTSLAKNSSSSDSETGGAIDDGHVSVAATSVVNSSRAQAEAHHEPVRPKPLMRKRSAKAGAAVKARREAQISATQRAAGRPTTATRAESAARGRDSDKVSQLASGMNLRQKLAEVRRRIGYIQKRGHNVRQNYRYVASADIAGAVGDLLSELGVVVIPSLESVSYVPIRNPGGQIERIARVIMTYTFTDVDTAEAATVKVPGEGLDAGDKATYKAMTGALKYALLQSFLLASGDDPEDDRHEAHRHGAVTRDIQLEHTISSDQIAELKQLIDETGTDLERVLAYYKLASLEVMTEPVYRRALELLNRKRAAQTQRETSHAQG